MIKRTYLTLLLLVTLAGSLQSQTILTKGEAVRQIMENNFNVIISLKNLEIAENNTSIFNSGYLPTLTGNAAINYNRDRLEVQFRNGEETSLAGALSDNRSAGLSLNYVLFDGFNRKYNMQRNNENLNRAQLEMRSTLETTLIDLFNTYYQVGRTQQNLKSLQQTLQISKERLLRAQYGFDYGRNSRLDVSNAQVDVNTDSINLLNARQSLENAKRSLNFIMGQRVTNTEFEVDTTLTFAEVADKNELMSQVLSQNVLLLIAKADLSISQYDTRINRSRYLPTLSASGGYNYRLGNNNDAAFTASNSTSGVTAGLSLGWNLFDGGATTTATQNARVTEDIRNYSVEQLTLQLQVDFDNAWADYQNRLFIVDAQESNLKTNQQNFERTREQYKLGQVSSIDFRTAQANLLIAQTSLTEARYDAKLAELLIFQLSGRLQEADF